VFFHRGGAIMSFLPFLVVVNLVSFVLFIATSGKMKMFFLKVWLLVLLVGVATVFILVKNGQLQ